ncbi:MAG: MaoC family dehydratase [Deferrisomatales bacterium]|nr:MaoC family dehydratase [Deferrisomatales bacterium]
METGKTVQELNVGDRASLSRVVSEADLGLFAGATGDVNPIHFDEPYAQSTFFKGRIAHGILSAGLLSAVIANRLPGLGTVYVSQNLSFLAPVRVGDTVTAAVEVLEADRERNRVRLRTTCANQDGTLVVDGEAVVMPPKRKPSADVAEGIAQRSQQTGGRLAAATAAFAEAFQG